MSPNEKNLSEELVSEPSNNNTTTTTTTDPNHGSNVVMIGDNKLNEETRDTDIEAANKDQVTWLTGLRLVSVMIGYFYFLSCIFSINRLLFIIRLFIRHAYNTYIYTSNF